MKVRYLWAGKGLWVSQRGKIRTACRQMGIGLDNLNAAQLQRGGKKKVGRSHSREPLGAWTAGSLHLPRDAFCMGRPAWGVRTHYWDSPWWWMALMHHQDDRPHWRCLAKELNESNSSFWLFSHERRALSSEELIYKSTLFNYRIQHTLIVMLRCSLAPRFWHW